MRRETLQNFKENTSFSNSACSPVCHQCQGSELPILYHRSYGPMDTLIHHATAGCFRSHFRRVWAKWTEVAKNCSSFFVFAPCVSLFDTQVEGFSVYQLHTHRCIYIYTYIQYICIYIYIHIHTVYLYIYIYTHINNVYRS